MFSVTLLSKFAINTQLKIPTQHIGHIVITFWASVALWIIVSVERRFVIGLIWLIGLIGLIVLWILVVLLIAVGLLVWRIVGIFVVIWFIGTSGVVLECSRRLRIGHFSRRMVVGAVSLG